MKLPRILTLVLAVLLPCAAFAQQNWQWVNTLPASIGWKSAAFGSGLYVVVGGDGTLVTSPDAITWTPRQVLTSGAFLTAVTFANGRFVAVGNDSVPNLGSALVLTSTDGINWAKNDTVASTILANLAGVAYGNNTWVISGASQNRVLTSSDGLTWTARNATANTGKIAFGGGVFVASTNNNRAVVSPDGTTWTSVTINSSTSAFYEGMTYGAGKFMTAGRSGGTFKAVSAVSTDGVTWTLGADVAESDNGAAFVAFSNNVFIMGNSGALFSSTDGLTWTKRTTALPPSRSTSTNGLSTENVGGLAGANNVLFTFGIYGSITTSTDGTAWTRRSTGTAHDINGLVHDGTRFVGVGSGGTVVTSPDGIAWTANATNVTSWFGKLVYANGIYAACGLNGLWTSTNLTTWANQANTSFNQMQGIIYADGRFVAVNTGISTGFLVSTNGTTWTTVRITGASGSVQGLAWGGGVYVVTVGGFGSTPRIYSSTDATNWTERTPASFTVAPDSLAYANGRFALLASGNSWTSTDGINWTANSINLSGQLNSLFSVNNKFIARSGYACVASDDGVTWTLLENSLTANSVIAAMVAKDGKVIAVGGGGTILRGTLAGAAPPMPQTLSATVAAGATVQWQRNGNTVSGATSASLALADVQPADAGVYSAVITSGATTSLQNFIVGVSSAAKVIGTGSEVGPNIPHANGNIYDQLLLEGVAATFTSDSSLGQITRLSFVDLSNDIVQVEYAGPGSVSIVLDGSSGPATATNYNQPTVSYMKGHAGIVVTGANENSNLTVFSVGRGNAVNQGLFKSVTYDGFADLAFVAISTTNGKFGGLRTANVSYFATKGLTGVYAPGVQFTGPVYIGDISASDNAIPAIIVGSGTTTQINGGDLLQANNRAIQVATLTPWTFVGGSTSHHTTADPHLLAAQNNRARFEQNGADVTSQVVINPPASSTPAAGTQLTYFAAGSNPPFANGAKKTFTVTATTLQFDSTTLTNPTTLPASGTVTGVSFTDAATGLVWEVYFLNGVFHEINVMRNGQFVGQWS